jgi:hypothetical protein
MVNRCQINSGLQLFAKLGVTVPDELIFNDGVSGDFPNRKGYQRLRQAVRERKGNFVYSHTATASPEHGGSKGSLPLNATDMELGCTSAMNL